MPYAGFHIVGKAFTLLQIFKESYISGLVPGVFLKAYRNFQRA